MSRLFTSLFVLLSSFSLVAAAPLVPPKPIVVIYPFTLNGSSLNKEAGSRLTDIVANQMAATGGLIVKPPLAGIDRKDYLIEARKLDADYYISGYVTPFGDNVSVVEQVVSTETGVVIFSNTAQLLTYADAAGQGDLLARSIVQHSRRNLDAYNAPPPPRPSPSAEGSGNEADIGKLFSKRRQAKLAPAATPTPTGTPTPATTPRPVAYATAAPPAAPTAVSVNSAPRETYAVTAVTGSADPELRDATTRGIVSYVNQHRGTATAVDTTTADLPAAAGAACAAAHASTVLGASLNAHTEMVFGQSQTTATLELSGYTCNGTRFYHKTFDRDAGGDWHIAIDRVVSGAIGAYLNPPKPRG